MKVIEKYLLNIIISVDKYLFLCYILSMETEINVQENPPPYQWLRGCCKGKPEGSVENFLARCREDKEYELAIEKRQEEERARLANAKIYT